mmetsp:Transcript_36753/g.71275  ORF Transcript_36753/g.71275 Transcript_36753/m.71275 type:complete len:388 (-) Transcript_36753:42-1205(-)
MDTENLFGHFLGLQSPSLRSLPASNASASDSGSVASSVKGADNKGGSKEEDGITDKKLRRRLQNRRAAKVSRARKKAYIELLEGKTQDLQEQIRKLQERNKALEARVSELESSGPVRPQREKKATRRFCPYKSSNTAVPKAKASKKEAKAEEVKTTNNPMETEGGGLFVSGADSARDENEVAVPGSPDLSWVTSLEAAGLDLPPLDPFTPVGLWEDPFVQQTQNSQQQQQQTQLQQRVSDQRDDESNPGPAPFSRAQAAARRVAGRESSGDIASSAVRNDSSQQQQVSPASRSVSQGSLQRNAPQALVGLYLLAVVSFLSKAFGSSSPSAQKTAKSCSAQTSLYRSCRPELLSSRTEKVVLTDRGGRVSLQAGSMTALSAHRACIFV